jgi:hypothetical protein
MARVESNRGYRIAQDRRAITCLVCGSTSYNQGDIDRLFCAVCDIYHEDRELLMRLERELYATR